MKTSSAGFGPILKDGRLRTKLARRRRLVLLWLGLGPDRCCKHLSGSLLFSARKSWSQYLALENHDAAGRG